MTLARGSSRALRLLLSLGLLTLVLWLAHSRSVVGVLRQIESRWLAVVIWLGIAECLLLTCRWQILPAARGVPAGFPRLFAVQLAANFFGASLASSMGVDAVRIAALFRAGNPTALVVGLLPGAFLADSVAAKRQRATVETNTLADDGKICG